MKKEFPLKGRNEQSLLDELKDLKENDVQWKKGRAFSYIYYAEEAISETLKKAYLEYFSENALNPSAFPSLRNMEIQVIDMCLEIFEGKEDAVGSMTSGGTESILMAVKSAKEFAKIHNGQIKNPEIILPLSVHPAFNKACDYFGVKAVMIELEDSFLVDPIKMEQAINENTIMLVASAPSYPQGVIDPIEEIGKLALKYNLLFHVDACVGGFVLPFVDHEIKNWNLSVPGVSSLSADIHKYGFASKGSSVILYNKPILRKVQFYVYTDWPGGMYASPAVLGTKPGGAIAVAWTILQFLGREGYQKMVQRSMITARKVQDFINNLDGFEVLGKPDMCIFSFSSSKMDIYEVGDEMQVKNWFIDRQQNPASLHLSISPFHEQVLDEFISDFEDSIRKLSGFNMHSWKKKLQLGASKGIKKILSEKAYKKLQDQVLEKSEVDSKRSAALYGMMGDLKGDGELDDIIRSFLDKMMKSE